jgi:hypothetical protein
MMRPMRLLPCLLVVGLIGACGGEDFPTAAELYGTWTATTDGTTRDFVFAATDDGSHPELAGLSNVYVLFNYPEGGTPAEIQTGEYRVQIAQLTTGGEDEALVTVVHAGPGTGGTYGNAIYGWTGDTLTIESASGPGGELEFARVTTP